MISRIIRRLHRIIRDSKETLYFKQFLDGAKGSYRFHSQDLKLYLNEKKQKLKGKKVENWTEDIVRVIVGNHVIAWPRQFSNEDLPWLHHEIFDDYEGNPSSYDHPRMDWKGARWVLDAGCCEGYFSQFVFDKNPATKVIAMEPIREMGAALEKTFEKEIASGNFFLQSCALSREKTTVRFACQLSRVCDSAINYNEVDEGKDVYEVTCMSLDALTASFGLGHGGIVKMDIEGAEMEALEGGERLLRDFRPKLALAVYHEYENALRCRDIILRHNSSYTVEFRGLYGYFLPPRPYMLFAF